ncbi:toll-like receptor 3 [Gigantopelta aegis]|uniref:toll-like receptor 3 n=1 Tax=Gigantopelta aegis TaxID=1735272 RepID=UPI001B88C4CE|nr:toll-like receptor 3 [Gigantopelta aegis]
MRGMGLCLIIIHIVAFTFAANATPDSQRIWKFCFRQLCLCPTAYFAKCTDHGNNLTYIPALNSSIVGLNFSFNHLDSVTQHTFLNVSALKITVLVLRSNNINFMTPDAFCKLKYLQKLELSGNPVGLASLKGVLQSLWTLPIQMLSINHMEYGDLLYEAIAVLNSTTLTEIHMDWSRLTYYNQTSFKHIPNLEHLDLDNNAISSVLVDHSPFPKILSVMFNSFFTFPNFCDSGTHLVLTDLFLDHNRITDLDEESMNCLKDLKILSLNTNPIKHIRKNAFMMLHSLQVLILRALNGPLKNIEHFAFNNTKLFRIDIRDNDLNMQAVSPRMFWGCVNLKRLSMSYNRFHYITETAMEELFEPLKHLTYLELGNCGLQTIPNVVTTNLTELKWLSLYKNYIKVWPPGTFAPLRSLTDLYLMGNLIGSIQEDSFPPEFRQRLKHINLAENPFSCTCDLLWFLNWFKTNRTIFKEMDHSYICSSPLSVQNVQLTDIQLSEEKCLIAVTTAFAIVAVASFGMLLTIVVSLLYRKRWSLKHYWYMRGHRQRRHLEIERDYTYDVCVIYCEEDLEWIIQEMLPFLEDTKGLKLCVEERDFIPGKPMIDSIAESVLCSRGFILVVSNSFMEEEWCQFQLQVAIQHNNARDLDLFVVILLEEVDRRHMTPGLYAVLRTRDYIRWPASEEDRARLWEDVYREIIH